MKERVIILIDGSNFYFKLRDLRLHHLLSCDFSRLVQSFAGQARISQTTYYVGKVRTDGTKKTQRLFNDQRRLLAHLKKHHIRYSLGYLLKSDGVFHEKGVDVQMASDILITAYENLADRIILVSSDTDLIPAIEKAQDKGKVVEYVGFSHKVSRALARICQATRTLTRDDLIPFIQKEQTRSR